MRHSCGKTKSFIVFWVNRINRIYSRSRHVVGLVGISMPWQQLESMVDMYQCRFFHVSMPHYRHTIFQAERYLSSLFVWYEYIFSQDWGVDDEKIFIFLVLYAALELRFFVLYGMFKLHVTTSFMQHRSEIGELMMKWFRCLNCGIGSATSCSPPTQLKFRVMSYKILRIGIWYLPWYLKIIYDSNTGHSPL